MKTVGLLPYYYLHGYSATGIVLLQDSVSIFRRYLDEVYVVDDGAGLPEIEGAKLMRHDVNRGQSEAIRTGLQKILQDSEVGFIIESDADKDQDPKDGKRFLQYFHQNQINPDNPVLLIGDRYTPPEFRTPIEYRRCINDLQLALFSQFGCPVRDTVSGLRAYTSSFAKAILEKSKSNNYGIHTEEVVIAGLIGAKVDNIDLSYSRPRDPFTKAGKLVEILDAILCHDQELRKKGHAHIVNLVKYVQERMKLHQPSFSFDSTVLGLPGTVEFTLVGNDTYTAKRIPT